MDCSACDRPAVTTLPYAGRSLCEAHFVRLVERRFKRELRGQLSALELDGGARIAVGLSGGKDSVALAALLVEALGQDPRFEVAPVLVDEGIPGYRDVSLERAREAAECLGLTLEVVSHAADHGRTTDEIALANPGARPCAACGVMRRSSLNRAARALGADVLATGHNLDDHAETTLMNLLRGDLEQVLRTAPHAEAPAGLVPRISPLRTTPEREAALYAVLRELPFHGQECPHSEDATRRTYRAMLLDLLDRDPGVRHTLVNLTDELKARVAPREAPLVRCQRCGDVASGPLCRACQVASTLRAEEKR